MSNFFEYFQTDWAAMTRNDWAGLIVTVVLFVLMFGMYYWVLSPRNKEKLESYRTMAMDDDNINVEK